MLIRVGYPRLAKDLCDYPDQPWPVYVADIDVPVGVLQGRFDESYDERYAHYVPAGHPPPQAWIFDIVVDSDSRRQGIGSALIQRFAVDAAEAGCTYVALEVNLQHGDGLPTRLEFFRKQGFVPLTMIMDKPEIMGASISHLRQIFSARDRPPMEVLPTAE
jgi:GNAT superfamily N-acetyltransferase